MRLRPWAEAALGMTGETNLHMIGAPFQLKVWEALLNIPSGHVTTYSEVAQSIGRPKAVRAVGTAVGRYPIAVAQCASIRADSHASMARLTGKPQ